MLSRLGILCAVVVLWGGEVLGSDVTVGLQDFGKGRYRLEGHVSVEACADSVWSVLTAYSDISSFVSSMRKSSVKEYMGDRILLEQEAAGKVLFFSRRVRVMLMVSEKPMSEIAFKDIEHRDFKYYNGSWKIEKSTTGLDITYLLECQRNFAAPNFLAKGALRKSAAELLSEVRDEIIRRKGEHHESNCSSS
jgi:ribosome-associated toxin RatA of RatAB toxin-antitoxin module